MNCDTYFMQPREVQKYPTQLNIYYLAMRVEKTLDNQLSFKAKLTPEK
jgi:hypothetical protein